MDFTVVKDTSDSKDPTISVSNETDGLCAVRVTKMSDGTTQYQSNITFGTPSNKTTAFTFNIIASENYIPVVYQIILEFMFSVASFK